MQDLNCWRLVKFTGSAVQLVHRDEIGVVLHLKRGGMVDRAEIALLPQPKQQEHSKKQLSTFLFARLKKTVEAETEAKARVRIVPYPI